MLSFAGRARFASLLAVACALLLAGAAAGAAGQALILGQNNDSGTSQTVLANAGLGAAFTLKTTNTANNATGIFGWTSQTTGTATRGVYGKADGANSYGVFGRQSGVGGSGAAVYAEGNNNVGVIATSTANTALTATSESGSGIFAVGTGFAVAILGDGTDALYGIYGTGNPTIAVPAIVGTSSADQGRGLAGQASNGIGVEGTGEGSGTIDFDCATTTCWDHPGGAFAGNIGVIGQTDGLGPEGYSRGVLGIASGSGAYGVYSEGDARVVGNLSVTGTCTGCTTAAIAQNASGGTIRQGDALTAVGVTNGADGSIIIKVAKAKQGDAVLGIADVSMTFSAEKVTVAPISHKSYRISKDKGTTTSKAITVTAKERKWLSGDTSSADGQFLRVITSGMFAYAGTAPTSAAAGDTVAVGAATGKVGKAPTDVAKGASAGKYLGKLKDGRVVLMVDPS